MTDTILPVMTDTMNRRRPNPTELAGVLAQHRLWLADPSTGRRANLRGAYLWYAYLRGANLTSADLRDTDLEGADLRGADLRDANLRGAHLRDTDLQGAYLHDADLRGAHLRNTDLRGALGVVWAAEGPHGVTRTTALAVWMIPTSRHRKPQIMVGAGCGWQPFPDALTAVMAHPEEWPAHSADALEAEWVDCLWRLHNSIHRQLESL